MMNATAPSQQPPPLVVNETNTTNDLMVLPHRPAVVSAARPTTTTSTTTSMSINRKLSAPCSKRLRTGLLHKLGIVDEENIKQSAATTTAAGGKALATTTSTRKQNQRASILGPDVKVIKAPLKGNEDLQNTGAGLLGALGSLFKVGSPTSLSSSVTSASSTDTDSSQSVSLSSSSSSSPQRRSLTFDEQVSVVHIPRREQYSNRIQQHLWHSSEQLQAAVMRNTVEYAADGWKWQQVREEQDHIVCQISGELIHPVHEEIAKLIRQEQGLPDDVPVETPFLKNIVL